MKGKLISLALAVPFAVAWVVRAQDPLPSWNETASKKEIVDFVQRVTKEGTPDFVRPEERIATFDNDGTLWAEQPIYFQVLFMRDRVKALLPQHPEWRHREPFASLLGDDIKAVAKMREGVPKLMAATHTGIITDEFTQIVMNWVSTAKHPTTGRPFIEMVYQPMLLKLPEMDFVDNYAGKAIGIQKFIGRRPILAFGNSDGDQQMLEWTAAGSGARFMALVHHDDAEREWAYDRNSNVGRLDKAWDEAVAKGWIVVSMKDDWKTIFPPTGIE
jgi:hypothetical protein